LYTIKQFLKSGVHLGHYKWECDYRMSYFLMGIRNFIHIINLYYTLLILKRGLYIAYNVCILNQRILVANNVGYKLSVNFEKINKGHLWYINNKWISGLLSNQKEILFNNKQLLKNYNLGYNSLLPSYVFASNIKQTTTCILEATLLNIPSSALIDSNVGIYGIFYGIPSNDDNFVSIYLFTRLFVQIYLKAIYDNITSLNISNINKVYRKLLKKNRSLRIRKMLMIKIRKKYKFFHARQYVKLLEKVIKFSLKKRGWRNQDKQYKKFTKKNKYYDKYYKQNINIYKKYKKIRTQKRKRN